MTLAAGLERGEGLGDRVDRADPGDQPVARRRRRSATSRTARSKSSRSYSAGAEQLELAPEEPVQVDRSRLRVDGDHDQPAADGQDVDRGGDARRRSRTPRTRCRRRRPRSSSFDERRRRRSSPDRAPRRRARRRPGAGTRRPRPAGPVRRRRCATAAISTPTGPPPTTTTCSPAPHVRAPDVVDGDRGRFDERRVLQRQVRRQREDEVGRDVPALTAWRPESRCRGSCRRWQMWECPAQAGGAPAAPPQSASPSPGRRRTSP